MDHTRITWMRGRPLLTVFSITWPTLVNKSDASESSGVHGLVNRTGAHHLRGSSGVLSRCFENNWLCEALHRAVTKLVRAFKFNFKAASSNNLPIKRFLNH